MWTKQIVEKVFSSEDMTTNSEREIPGKPNHAEDILLFCCFFLNYYWSKIVCFNYLFPVLLNGKA